MSLVTQRACLRRACWSRAGCLLTGTSRPAAGLLLQPRGRGACLVCGSACRLPLESTWAITGPSSRSEPVTFSSVMLSAQGSHLVAVGTAVRQAPRYGWHKQRPQQRQGCHASAAQHVSRLSCEGRGNMEDNPASEVLAGDPTVHTTATGHDTHLSTGKPRCLLSRSSLECHTGTSEAACLPAPDSTARERRHDGVLDDPVDVCWAQAGAQVHLADRMCCSGAQRDLLLQQLNRACWTAVLKPLAAVHWHRDARCNLTGCPVCVVLSTGVGD